DHDHDVSFDHDHDVSFDHDHDVSFDHDHDVSFDHDLDISSTDLVLDHSFKFTNVPFGALLGIFLLSFGMFGILFYYFILIDPILSITLHLVLTIFIMFIFNRIFHFIFQETGIHIELRDLIGLKGTATVNITNDFGEISVKTSMGYKRYLARPIFSTNDKIEYNRGEELYIIGAIKKIALVSDNYLKGNQKNQLIKNQIKKLKI
ncbi:MAG: hypothetical protein ACTSVE_07500, partial [Candidatus Helarchaeota archaeon]